MIYSASSTPEPNELLSQKAYDFLEESLESWYLLSHWNRIYDNGVKLGKEHIVKNFDLVVEDHCQGVVMVYLQHKESGYRPFKVAIDKAHGEIK